MNPITGCQVWVANNRGNLPGNNSLYNYLNRMNTGQLHIQTRTNISGLVFFYMCFCWSLSPLNTSHVQSSFNSQIFWAITKVLPFKQIIDLELSLDLDSLYDFTVSDLINLIMRSALSMSSSKIYFKFDLRSLPPFWAGGAK